jgi:hypothetical protein
MSEPLTCPACNGYEYDEGVTCSLCSGTGYVTREAYEEYGRQYQREQILSAQSDAHQENP